MKNAFDIGNFFFFRDPDLQMKLSSTNLYDQMDPDGWINIWFGGVGKYIPDIGDFRAHVISSSTFYWDIVDERGKRTKEGLERLYISRNENVVPWYGDLVPSNPSEVFDYTINNAAPIDTQIISANLWFYDNLLTDGYYRYNLVLLPKGVPYPNEQQALIRPVTKGIMIPRGYYIAAYRPKPEYRYQLAVMPVVKSGKEYSIHFRIKLDLDYLFENPTSERYLRIYALNEDHPSYMLYPEDPLDLVWDRFNEEFVPEYKRYLLVYGIQQRLPSRREVAAYVERRANYLYYSNMILMLDSFNFQYLVSEIEKKLNDEEYKLDGIARFIWPFFSEWVAYKERDIRPYDVEGIMNYVLMKVKPWKGFEKLYNAAKHIVIQPEPWDTDPAHFIPSPKKIVEIDGIKQFEDGYIPERAVEYLNPPVGYVYAGATGNGMYKLMISGKECSVYCDMENGGWMLIVDMMFDGAEYVRSLLAKEIPSDIVVEEDKGVSLGSIGARSMLEFGVKYNAIKMRILDDGDGCGKYTLEIYGDYDYILKCWSDGCTSSMIVGQDVVYADNKALVADIYRYACKKTNSKLYIAGSGDGNMNKVRKFFSNIFVK